MASWASVTMVTSHAVAGEQVVDLVVAELGDLGRVEVADDDRGVVGGGVAGDHAVGVDAGDGGADFDAGGIAWERDAVEDGVVGAEGGGGDVAEVGGAGREGAGCAGDQVERPETVAVAT